MPPLDPDTWASGNVMAGHRVFFKLFLPAEAGQASVTLEMRIDAGDADLFLGNGDLARASRSHSHWSAVGWNNNKIVLHFFEPHFNLGYYYLTIEGVAPDRNTDGPCRYRLKWWWSELKSSMAEVASLPYQPPAASASLPY